MSHIKICDFVERELQFFRDECNFTPDELEFFDLRSKNKSLVEICFKMCISESKANVLSKKIRQKIIKVL